MAPLASAFITSFGNLSDFATEVSSPYFIYGSSLVSLAIGYDYLQGKIDTVHWLYFGSAMALIIELCSASYIIYKSVQAAISFTQGFAFNYRGGSILGNQIALYELAYLTLYLSTALGLILAAFSGAGQMW